MGSIANLLTIYRIAAAPVIAGLAIAGQREAFFLLLIISLATDAIDGPIARWTSSVSRLGARLDTIADGLTTLVGLLGIFIFERHEIGQEIALLYAFLATYALAGLACLMKFGVLPSYHLLLAKIGAVLAGAFVVWLFLFGFSQAFLAGVLVVGIIANLHSLLTTWRLKRFHHDLGPKVGLG